ncbi:MAG: alpha-galactosidase [Phycisphaerae bacterium]|nr:alpha-galactosidase [Phycisphaerae bacterium]
MPWPDGVESSPYDAHILTPRPPKTPRINAARVFGARPDAPINFLVATSGEDPIHFDATLPSGLSIDANSGLITGELHGPGDHVASITATNELGADTIEITFRVGDTIGLTPPMGWNSWNCWGKEVSQEKVLLSARALVDSGLIDHGWTYVNIDDAWQSRRGGPHNAIQPNDQFPDMAALCRDIHDMGLKVGTYSTPWVTSYAGFIGGSSDHVDGRWDESMNTHKNKRLAEHGFETEDARQWAEWGIDYLKYDWYPNDVPHTKAMRDALDATGRDILLSLSNKAPQDVASELAANSNLARTTRDIRDQWRWTGPHVHQGIADIWDKHDAWREHCRPGFFPDADMLVVGRVGWKDAHQPTRLTPDEQYTHISLWSLWASPLLIGCPLERLDRFTLSLLTNDEVIAVNQDPLGVMAETVVERDGVEVLVKPLADGSLAVGLFNRNDKPTTVTASWSDLGLTGRAVVRDLWRQQDIGGESEAFAREIAPHGVVFVRITPEETVRQ